MKTKDDLTAGELAFLVDEKPRKVKVPTAKIKYKRTIENTNSWLLIWELIKRHAVEFMIIGFWLEMMIIIWIRLGK